MFVKLFLARAFGLIWLMLLTCLLGGCSGRREGDSQGIGVADAFGADPGSVAPAVSNNARAMRLSPAAGYVDDARCGSCHAELYDSYQAVGMARSYAPIDVVDRIEDFENNHYYHPLSDQHFVMERRGDAVYQKRYQVDASGNRINELEVRVDAVIGSGNHVRSYLHRTPSGEMYQLPLAWYTSAGSSERGRWRMNPGYDRPDHFGFQRKISRECMFCHNAYPDAVAGSDEYWQPQLFPADLPHGIGCQRCHGPGEQHVQLALSDTAGTEAINAAIVNPHDLPLDRQEDVCNQCHLQPSSQILSLMVRIGRSDYSFRPGERLDDYRALLDYDSSPSAARPPTASQSLSHWPGDDSEEERFEINSHAYRMQASRCYIESAGELRCTTCHDPHRKVAAAEHIRHYRNACVSCHSVEQCHVAVEEDLRLSKEPGDTRQLADCTSCHMPSRRSHDVIHAVMTDHKILARPEPLKERLRPRSEPPPPNASMQPQAYQNPLVSLGKEKATKGDGTAAMSDSRVYELIAASAVGDDVALRGLVDYVREHETTQVQPLAELAGAFRDRGMLNEELQVLGRILEYHPEHVQANLDMAMALDAAGQSEHALRYYQKALDVGPPLPETHLGIGTSVLRQGNVAGAEREFREAVRLRPLYPEALLNLGIVLHAQQKWHEARKYLLQARAVQPDFTEVDFYLNSMP